MSFVDLPETTSNTTEICALPSFSTSSSAMNDSRSAENEIIQLMLYREAFLQPDPSVRSLHGTLARKVEELDQKYADTEISIIDNPDGVITK